MQLPPVRTIQEICGEDHPNLLLTKFRLHAPRYWIETLFLRTLQQNLTATAPERASYFAISAEYATFAATY